VNAAGDTNVSWSPGGGNRRYYVRGWSYFSYPTATTLAINDFYKYGGVGYIGLDLSTAIGTDLEIGEYSINVLSYGTSNCTGGSIDSVTSYPTFTLSKGFYGQFYATTDYSPPGASFKYENGILINGATYYNGQSFTVNGGATTVNVGIPTTRCFRYT